MLCPNCNTENRDSAKFCDSCGNKLDAIQESGHGSIIPHPEEGEERAERIRYAAKIILVLLLIFLAFLIFSFLKVPQGQATGAATSIVTTTIISNPSNGTAFAADIHYSANTSLSGDIATLGNIVIGKGVTVIANGYSIISAGTFNNSGTVVAGWPQDAAQEGSSGRSYPESYGGSGGSGGGGGNPPANGSVAGNPPIDNAQILSWYDSGFVNFLTGAGGGGACHLNGIGSPGGSTTVSGGNVSHINYVPCADTAGTAGASGSYGIYLQANRIIAGTINASGEQATQSVNRDAGGGGGGGVVILSYGAGGLVPGTYNVQGGAAQQNSGSGGAGQVWIYNYGSNPPITP